MKDKIDEQKFMQLALHEAKKAKSKDEIPIGAIVVNQGKVIGRGHNMKELAGDPTLHAEMIALKQAAQYFSSWRLENCSLYVTLEPCPMCAGALLQARIEKLVFGAFDKKAGACGSLYNLVQDERFNHMIEIKSGIMAEQSKKLLQDFFQKLRNK